MCLTYLCFIKHVYDDFSNMADEQNGRRKLQHIAQNVHFSDKLRKYLNVL